MDTLVRPETPRTNDCALFRRVAEEIILNGFAELEVQPDTLREQVPLITRGLAEITDDPALQALFPLQIIGMDNVGWDYDMALVRRDPSEKVKKKEEKFFFHYTKNVQWSRDGSVELRFQDFLSAFETVNTAARTLVLSVAKAIDDVHAEMGLGMPNARKAVDSSITLTRALRYLENSEVAIDAHVHIDRSFLTVHWYATHSGLVVFDKSGKPHRVNELAWNRVAIFPGKKFGGLFCGTEAEKAAQGHYGFGTPHGVKDLRRVQSLRDGDRYALVSFVHADIPDESAAWISAKKTEMDAFEALHRL